MLAEWARVPWGAGCRWGWQGTGGEEQLDMPGVLLPLLLPVLLPVLLWLLQPVLLRLLPPVLLPAPREGAAATGPGGCWGRLWRGRGRGAVPLQGRPAREPQGWCVSPPRPRRQ